MVIGGVHVEVGPEAVLVTAERPLTVLSSAVTGGGLVAARAIVNLHVAKNYPCAAGDPVLDDFVRRRRVPRPWVGLLTSAWTEQAEVASASGSGLSALAVVTVGLGNAVAAGLSPAAGAAAAGTINAIVVMDADAEPAALVNAVITVTEVKASVLAAAGVRCPDGQPATGTSTDAVVAAATGRGRACRFGGPISELGWVAARAARSALEAGVHRWLEDHA